MSVTVTASGNLAKLLIAWSEHTRPTTTGSSRSSRGSSRLHRSHKRRSSRHDTRSKRDPYNDDDGRDSFGRNSFATDNVYVPSRSQRSFGHTDSRYRQCSAAERCCEPFYWQTPPPDFLSQPSTPGMDHPMSFQGYGPTSQTPAYYQGSGYTPGEEAPSRRHDYTRRRATGFECIFCPKPGRVMGAQDPKTGEEVHPYIVYRSKFNGQIFIPEAVDDRDSDDKGSHGHACSGHQGRLKSLWDDALRRKDGCRPFDPDPTCDNYQWYLFANRDAYSKYKFVEVEYEIESVA
jgi:hypothetical protein